MLTAAEWSDQRRQTVEERPRSRRNRFHARSTEPDDAKDMDQVLSMLDRMNFKPSKNRVAGTSPVAANNGSEPSVDAASLSVHSDVSQQSSAVEETCMVSPFPGNSTSISTDEADTALREDDDLERSSRQSSGAASRTTTENIDKTPVRAPASAVAHIPRSVMAWKSLSGDCRTTNTLSADLENSCPTESLHLSPVEPVGYESHSETQVSDSGRSPDVVRHVSETVAGSFPSSVAASAVSTRRSASSGRQLGEEDHNARLREVIGESHCPQAARRAARPQSSTSGVCIPHLLSADACYYLDQEEGDVIIETSSEEELNE